MKKNSRRFLAIAFDLDDTLLDTTHLIVPHAINESYQELIKGGIQCDTAAMESIRQEMIKSVSHREIFKHLAEKFHLRDQDALNRAIQCFYSPSVPDSLPLLPGALENLISLKEHYSLYLVTSGQVQSQTKKIKSMGIKSYFRDIYIVEGIRYKQKRNAFADIIEREKISADQLLSVGNRLATEIRDAKTLGAHTCYFRYGEHVGESPQCPEDHPDFTIEHHRDLINVCRL